MIVEGDSQILIRFLQQDHSLAHHFLFQDIKHLFQEAQVQQVRHIFREANFAVDVIAILKLSLTFGYPFAMACIFMYDFRNLGIQREFSQ